jgi:hypothetical protein
MALNYSTQEKRPATTRPVSTLSEETITRERAHQTVRRGQHRSPGGFIENKEQARYSASLRRILKKYCAELAEAIQSAQNC